MTKETEVKKAFNPVGILVFSGLALASGLVLGLMTAKKPGKELRKDAEKELDKLVKKSEKGIRIAKHNAKKLQSKIKKMYEEDGDFDHKFSQTFEAIKTKTDQLGHDFKNMITHN